MSGPYIPPPSAPTARWASYYYMILEKHRGPFYAEGTASWDSGDESSAARERWQNSFDSNQEGCTVAQACAGSSCMGGDAQEKQLLHLAMAARLCVHALADREAFAPQDLAALLITLDLMRHSGGRLLFSSGG